MTDPELVAKKLALIETCVRELRTLARPEAIRLDVRERRFVEHTLQIAIQAAIDVASHVVSDDRTGIRTWTSPSSRTSCGIISTTFWSSSQR